MRIVDRETFLAMPAGTIFAKFASQPKKPKYLDLNHGDLAIKWETTGNDFVTQDLFPMYEGWQDSDDYFRAVEAMLAGQPSPPVDYDCAGRDGLFDREQLFMVWDREDAAALIKMLQDAAAMAEGQTP